MFKFIIIFILIALCIGCVREPRVREGIVTCEASHHSAGVLIKCQDGTRAFVPRNFSGDPMRFGCFWPKSFVDGNCDAYGADCRQE